MTVVPLNIIGVFHVALDTRCDHRGCFFRTYDQPLFESAGLHRHWVQDNESTTLKRHTVRGLHFQRPPHAESKLIRVIHGQLLDVFVDCRLASPTFGQVGTHHLSAEVPAWLFLPPGIAHGFCSLTDDVALAYKVDQPFCAQADAGIRWDDPALNIPWPTRSPILSQKDQNLPMLAEVAQLFM